MTDIAAAKSLIQEESVRYRASVNEGVWFQIGGAINHILTKYYMLRRWVLNGTYTEVAIGAFDGLWPITVDMEILYIGMSNVGQGISGTTELDVKIVNGAGGSETSIFSTTPKISSAASNNTYLIKDLVSGAADYNPTGTTLPVLSSTTVDAQQSLKIDILQSMVGATTVALDIYYSPR